MTAWLPGTPQALQAKLAFIQRQGVVQWACTCLRSAPFLRSLLAKEKAKIAAKISAGIKRDGLPMARLPKQGRPAKAVLELLKAKESRNVRVAPGTNSMSGVVYIKGVQQLASGSICAVLCVCIVLYASDRLWDLPWQHATAGGSRRKGPEAVLLCCALHGGARSTRFSYTQHVCTLSFADWPCAASDEEHKQLMDDVYCLFSWTNPLHADIFPSVRQMEAEVVAMTASMLHGGPGTAAPDVCGAMTSGVYCLWSTCLVLLVLL